MFSAVHPTTDIAKILRHIRFVASKAMSSSPEKNCEAGHPDDAADRGIRFRVLAGMGQTRGKKSFLSFAKCN